MYQYILRGKKEQYIFPSYLDDEYIFEGKNVAVHFSKLLTLTVDIV